MPASNDGEEEDEEGGEEEESTQFVCDWSDGVRKAVKLDMLNIIESIEMVHNQELGVWCCVQDYRSLGDDVASLARAWLLHNPEHGKVKGRKPSARLKPAHGPGSSRRKRKK